MVVNQLSETMILLFDLDGTLIDSKKLISHALNHTLEKFGYRRLTEEEIINTINTPLREIFAIRAKREEIPKMREFYRRYYLEKCLPKTNIIPGIPELLKELKENKIKTAVITTRNEKMAEHILKHFNLIEYVDTVVGHLDGRKIKPDPEPLFIAVDRLKGKTSSSIMIGDSPVDIEAGLQAECYATIGVLWGFASKEMLKKADFIVDNVADLKKTLIKLIKKRSVPELG